MAEHNLNLVKAVFTDGTKVIAGANHETQLEADRFAGCVRDSWDNVVSAEVIHEIPAVKIASPKVGLILK